MLYYGTSFLGLCFAFERSTASPIWPAAGVALAGLILLNWRAWPGIWLGAFTVNVVTFLNHQAGTPGTVLWVSALIACGNILEALMGWFLWHRWREPDPRVWWNGPIWQINSVFKFAGIALLMSLISAFIGSTAVCAGGLVPWTGYELVWLGWWLGDASGILLVTPFVLAWARPDSMRGCRPFWPHALGAFALLGITAWAVFTSPEGRFLPYITIIPLVWIASTLGPRALTRDARSRRSFLLAPGPCV